MPTINHRRCATSRSDLPKASIEDSLSLNRKEPQERRISPWDVRRAAYWSVFAGSFGHTYGHRSFIGWMRQGETFKWGAHIPWYESLDAPAANQMQHLRSLMETYSLVDHVPDATLLADAGPRGKAHLQARRAPDGHVALVYSPLGKPIPVQMDKLTGDRVEANWYDPRTGESQPGGIFDARGTHTFQPPSSGEDHDWVLVLKGK